MPQPVVVVGIFVAARDRGNSCHDELDHFVPDTRLVPCVGHCIRKPLAYAKLHLGLAQEKQPGIRGLGASSEINCEFLAFDRWQIEGEQRSFCHDGCGAARIREALRVDTDLLGESRSLRYSRYTLPHI